MSIRLRTAVFALLVSAPLFAACAAAPTAPVDREQDKLNLNAGDTTSRRPTQPWN